MSLEAQGAERAILAILLQKPDSFFAINDFLSEADFVNAGMGMVFGVTKDIILSDANATLDPHVIFVEAEKKGLDEFFHYTLNGELVEALFKMSVNPNNLNRYIADVKQASIKRALIHKCEDLKGSIEDYVGSSVDLRNLVENSILDSVRAMDSGEDDIICLADDFEEVISTYADHEGDIGLDLGLHRWQDDIGHVRNGALTGLFASTKVGKSQFSMWAAFKTSLLQRLPCLYLDTELQPRQQQMRLCGIISAIPYNIIESGKWKHDKGMIKRIKEAFDIVKNAPLYYKNIAGRSVNSVIPVIRKFTYNSVGGPVDGDMAKMLVIYDYIKLMTSVDLSKNMQEYQLIGLLLSSLHDCAAHLNIPIIVLGQLNKQEDIGIRRIVENVDSATILRPKRQEELDEDGPKRGTHALEVRYSRHGPGHDFNEWINVHFDKRCGQFSEDKRNSEIVTAIKNLKAQLEADDMKQFGDVRE